LQQPAKKRIKIDLT
jgi:hypothetical protein